MPKTSDRISKNLRTLRLYNTLCEGRLVSKAALAKDYGIDERSVQRDIDDIRTFLAECLESNPGDNREIIYDRAEKGF